MIILWFNLRHRSLRHQFPTKWKNWKPFFVSSAFPFLPDAGGHTWSEVKIDGEWKPIDSYINDKPFVSTQA
jgi:hypothetical protein